MEYEKGIPDFGLWVSETWWIFLSLAVGGVLVGLLFGFLDAPVSFGAVLLLQSGRSGGIDLFAWLNDIGQKQSDAD